MRLKKWRRPSVYLQNCKNCSKILVIDSWGIFLLGCLCLVCSSVAYLLFRSLKQTKKGVEQSKSMSLDSHHDQTKPTIIEQPQDFSQNQEQSTVIQQQPVVVTPEAPAGLAITQEVLEAQRQEAVPESNKVQPRRRRKEKESL